MFKHWLNRNRRVCEGQVGLSECRSDYLIDLRQVVKTYPMPGNDLTVLKNIDLRVTATEFVAVVGKSGCGKTTLINMVTGIDRPTGPSRRGEHGLLPLLAGVAPGTGSREGNALRL